MKNTLYICTENNELYTLERLKKEFNEFCIENMTFEEYMNGALDMSGSLREVMSIRHYLYLINYTAEKETPISERERMYREMSDFDLGYQSEYDYVYYSVPFQEAIIYHQI